jgi:hypothetical protein
MTDAPNPAHGSSNPVRDSIARESSTSWKSIVEIMDMDEIGYGN